MIEEPQVVKVVELADKPEIPAPGKLPPIPRELLDPHGIINSANVFPGHNGLPFRGQTPQLKRNDARQPEVGRQAMVSILDLSNPEHLTYYQQVWQLFAGGLAELSSEEKVYDEKISNWRVFLRWCYTFSYMPKNRHQR